MGLSLWVGYSVAQFGNDVGRHLGWRDDRRRSRNWMRFLHVLGAMAEAP